MRVKRYVVTSMPEAMSLIRGELGKDAVILSTKDIKTGGFLGMFGKKQIEVVAAVDSAAAASPAKPAPQPSLAAMLEAAAAEKAYAAPSTPPGERTYAVPSTSPSIAAAKYKPAPATPMASGQDRAIASHTASAPSISPASLVEQEIRVGLDIREAEALTAKSPAGFKASEPRDVLEQDVLKEVRELKTWIRQLSSTQAAEPHPPALASLLERLEEQEVRSSWRERLVEDLQAREDYGLLCQHDDLLGQAAREQLLSWLQPLVGESLPEPCRVLHFVGPTGVGKTTTIAKLAADFTLRQRLSVGLITADTYRIAAVDQLRTYADILGIPLEVVFSPAESARAFQLLEQKDVVLMDTAGRNYRSELQIHEVGSLLRSGSDADTLLVLSLTARTSDMEAVALPFIRHGVDKVIFTKLDETTVYGPAFNLMLEHGLKPVYLTFGQTVPDDLEPFSAERYISLLLGTHGHE